MRIIIDIREHELIDICKQMTGESSVVVETESLPIGDILLKTDEGKDLIVIERKTLADLMASIKDGRYEEQSHRLKNATGVHPHNIVYMIEGMFSLLRMPGDRTLAISAMTSLHYFKGFSVMRTGSVYETAETVIQMAKKMEKGFIKGSTSYYSETENTVREETPYSGFVKKVKKENITPENIGEIMLCQIPGISSAYARAILAHYDGFLNLLEHVKTNTISFANVVYQDSKGKSRKIPKSCEEHIVRLFGGRTPATDVSEENH